jgi:hypothetical protein
MEVSIDGVLLDALRASGMDDRLIAIHAAGVLAHDARSVRAMGVAGPGEATFEDDVVMAPIRLAHGVHWCGGQVRMVDAHRSLPGTALAAMQGRPLRDVVDHPAIPADVHVTGFRHEDTCRFQVGGGRRGDPVPVTIVETDARPTVLHLTTGDRLAAPVVRMWHDRATVTEIDTHSKTFHVLLGYVLLGCTFGYWAHSAGWTAEASVVTGVAATFVWLAMGVLAMCLGGKYVGDDDMPHLDYRMRARAFQESEGMRG